MSRLQTKEWRVIWKRWELAPKIKIYQCRRAAIYKAIKLGPEPWLAFKTDPDALICCSGDDCNCSGHTWRQRTQELRATIPDIQYIRIECRTVTDWSNDDTADLQRDAITARQFIRRLTNNRSKQQLTKVK